MTVVKRSLKKWLLRLRLLDVVQPLYFNLKTANVSVIRREWQYSYGRNNTTFELPPPALIFDVISTRWASIYDDSGKIIVDDMENILLSNSLSLASFGTILDFGCGCGRLIRHVKSYTEAELTGMDYNSQLVQWCSDHLAFADFHQNELGPPLSSASNSIDFVYARSVFTHLPEELQMRWMDELRRILRTNGYLYFSMHGRPLSRRLPESDRDRFESGKLVVTQSSFAGQNLCSTYASRRFVEDKLLNGFELVDFVEGRKQEHLRQDVYLVRKK